MAIEQIFDWLREQINKHSYSKYDRGNFFASFIGTKIAVDLINEAEAKWEAECCIRVVGKPFTSSCGQKYDKWTYVGFPYCSKCGKPIKISEVE